MKLKWLLAILLFHPIMMIAILLTLIMPFMIYGEIKNILNYEIPSSGGGIFVLSFLGLLVYLVLRSQFLGIPYRKITFLLPLLQMIIYTGMALVAAEIILNKWADQEPYSKGWAITLAFLSFAAVRLLMSLLFWKYPVVQRKNER